MYEEALREHRSEELARYKALALTPEGRASLRDTESYLRKLVRQEDGPPDNPLSAMLCALDGDTTAWQLVAIVGVLEDYEVE